MPFTLLLAANDENTGVGDFHRLAIVQLPPRVTDLNCRTPAQSAGGGGGVTLERGCRLNQSHSHSQSKCTSLRLRQSVGVHVHMNDSGGSVCVRHGVSRRSLLPVSGATRQRRDLSRGQDTRWRVSSSVPIVRSVPSSPPDQDSWRSLSTGGVHGHRR